jgi:hypothetical protein
MGMSNRTFIPLCVICALIATSTFAATTQPPTSNQPPPPQLRKIPPPPTDAQLILNNTTELLKQVAALTKEVNALTATVNSLTKAQSAEAATVTDSAYRLQSTCWLLMQIAHTTDQGACWGRTHPAPGGAESYSPFGQW